AQVAVQILPEAVGVARAEVVVDAPDGEVHLGELPGGRVALLPVDGNLIELAAVGRDEFLALDEHAAAAAAGVIDAAAVGFEHLAPEPDDAGGRVELAGLLALGAGALSEQVFVALTEHVAGLTGLITERDGADQVDQLTE